MGIDDITLSAFEEVHTMSLRAFISAEQLIYVTTYGFFTFEINFLKSSGGQESASEHPALRSGKTTFFIGLIIFAVSAIKCTPANTIIFDSTFEAT